MDLYIDKENLKSFIHSKDKDLFDDCMRMLKRQEGVSKLICPLFVCK